jgi:hypothetical protein
MQRLKRVFVAATGQNQGKTTLSLGLMNALAARAIPAGFIKPVGQRYVEADGEKVDEDAVLIAQVCGLTDRTKDMSPVIIDRGFTRRYIDTGDNQALCTQIIDAFNRISEGKLFALIEGTGHAGVGSVIGLSNATVAHMLGAKVVIVTEGGIGRPIDEIALNACLFRSLGVEVFGAVFNKILPDRLEEVKRYAQRGLAPLDIRLLGAIPNEPILGGPTVRQVLEEIDGDLINGEEELDNHVDEIVLGAMTPHNALEYFRRNVLVITPGDREDLILTAMSSAVVGLDRANRIAGLVLTGGLYPHKNIMHIIRRTTLPTIAVDLSSYEAASKIHDITVKIHPNDTRKIELVQSLIYKHVDVDQMLREL